MVSRLEYARSVIRQINISSVFQFSRILIFAIWVMTGIPTVDAFADLCVLKTGTYELSSKYSVESPSSAIWNGSAEMNTPCVDADVTDGTQDQEIYFDYAAGEDIAVDIVFEQSQVDGQQFTLDLFTFMMYYDVTYMEVDSCSPDPAGFFSDDMGALLGIPSCEEGTNSSGTVPAVVQNFMNFSGDDSPADPVNYILDQVVFANLYSASQQNAFTFTFDTTGGAPTDVGAHFNNSDSCPLLDKKSSLCDGFGVEFQEIYDSTLSVTIPPAVVGPPLSVSLTCRGISGCTQKSGSAEAILTYQAPNACYSTSACGAVSELCESYGVAFTDMSGEKRSFTGDGTFTETVNVGDVAQYSVRGIEPNGNAVDSTSLNGCEGVLTTTAVTCRCGDPPVIKLVSPKVREIGEDGNMTFSSGQGIEMKFLLDDPDDDLSVGLPDSITKLEFYYSNSTGSGAKKYIPVDLNANGEFTAYVPGEYVKEGQKLYFGVVAVDYDGMETTYPEGFDPDDVQESESMVISNILDLPANFGFIAGNEPYPSSFPFIVGNGELSKLYFRLSEVSDVTMRVYTMDGRVFAEIGNSEAEVSVSADECEWGECNYCNWATGCQWNGMGKDGKSYAGNGMYVVNIHVKSVGNTYMGQEFDYTKGIVVMR